MWCFRLLSVLFAIFLLASCVSSDSIGIGGTGLVAEAKPGSGGIGGTGKQALRPGKGGIGGTGKAIFAGKRKSGSGIGGTGISEGGLGGTGIVGTITGFGSIWVNEAHIHFNEDTPIRINNKLVDKNALRLGQVVAVLSERVESDYQAHTIDVVHEVIGPVTVSADSKQLIVLGQVLELESSVLLYDETTQNDLSIDDLVDLVGSRQSMAKVSGYRSASGSILASRVDIVSVSDDRPVPFQVMGRINGSHKNINVADLDLEVSPLLIPDDLSHRYMISGFIDGNDELVVEEIGVDSAETVLEGASNFIVQGLAELDDFEESIELAGMELALNEGLGVEFVSDLDLNEELIQIVGDFDGDNVFIEDFGYYSEHVEEFVELLHDISDEYYEPELDEFEFEGGYEFEDEFEYENYEDEYLDHEEFEDQESFESFF